MTPTTPPPLDLPALARTLRAGLLAAFGPDHERIRQPLALAEEAGEFVQAARRYLGLARTPGDLAPVAAELADVVITAFVTADAFGINLATAIAAKAAVVQTRGYRTPPASVPSLTDAPVGAKARIPDDAPQDAGLVLVRAASNEGWGDWHAVTDRCTGNWWSVGELENLGAVVTHLPAPVPTTDGGTS